MKHSESGGGGTRAAAEVKGPSLSRPSESTDVPERLRPFVVRRGGEAILGAGRVAPGLKDVVGLDASSRRTVPELAGNRRLRFCVRVRLESASAGRTSAQRDLHRPLTHVLGTEFERDDARSDECFELRCFDFAHAGHGFRDPKRTVVQDTRRDHGGDRSMLIGAIDGRVHVVACMARESAWSRFARQVERRLLNMGTT